MKKAAYQKPGLGTVEELSARLLQVNRELSEANEKLRLSEAQRNEMLSNISHDLRAPAAAMRSVVDTLLEDPEIPAGELAGLLEVMDRRTAVIERLIDELHYLVSLDLPSFRLAAQAMDLTAFVEEYSAMQEANQKFGRRRILCETSSSLQLPVLADTTALLRILDNLFENALRFTQDGDTIAVGCKPADVGVELYVRDSGAGIAEDKLEAIFERTYTCSSARTPDAGGGSGLGLSIVRRLAELHGGRVWCESAPGEGSVFRIILPPGDAGAL